MKDKLTNWLTQQRELAREISQDISHYGCAMARKARKLVSGEKQKRPVKVSKRTTEFGHKNTQAVYQRQNRQEAAAHMEQAVTRAYYQEGGIRYFGDNLVRFVKVVLPEERELQTLWAGGYNGCISPMLWQLEKLEEELETIRTSWDTEIPKFENEMLRTIRLFARMASKRNLHQIQGWTAVTYAEELKDYAWNLERQLLDVYKLS